MIRFFLVLLISAPCLAKEITLIDVYRSKPGVGERFLLKEDQGNTYLWVTSNFLNRKKLEFGLYEQKKVDIKKTLVSIIKSERKKTQKNLSPHAWQVRILAQEISRDNPRFEDVFQLLKKLYRQGRWKRRMVSRIRMEKDKVLIQTSKNGKIIERKEESISKICNQIYQGDKICELPGGFIYTGFNE